jgi:hypothetical protein
MILFYYLKNKIKTMSNLPEPQGGKAASIKDSLNQISLPYRCNFLVIEITAYIFQQAVPTFFKF